MSFLDRNLFNPPYRGVPFAAAAILLLYFLLDPSMPIFTGQLADPDDYMRLVQVINWLQGQGGWQGWLDTSQPRISPDLHPIIPWSRLVDIPIAGCMLALQWLSGFVGANPTIQTLALWASYIVPPLYLIPLVMLTSAMARPFLGRARANLVPLLWPIFWGVLFNITPGRVDHHIQGILVAMMGLYAVPRLLLCKDGWKAAVVGGVAFAAGLQICTEIVPFLMLCWLAIGLVVIAKGGFALRNATVFCAATALGCCVLLPLTLPSSAASTLAVSWFSPAHCLMTTFVAVAFGAVFLIEKCLLGRNVVVDALPTAEKERLPFAWNAREGQADRQSPSAHVNVALKQNRKYAVSRIIYRGALLFFLGVFAAALFVAIVPASLRGAYADYDSFTATRLLTNISEVRKLADEMAIIPYNDLSRLKSYSVFLDRVLPLSLIVFYGFLVAAFSPARRRGLWLFLSVVGSVFLALSVFYMLRAQRFADIAAIIILGHAFFALWGRIARNRPQWEHILGAAGVFLLFIVLPHMTAKIVARPLINPAAGEASDATNGTRDRTDTCRRADLIRTLLEDTSTPHTIMAPYDHTPEILFYTPHRVIGGNYNLPGNRDVYDFFNARDEETAQTILRRWGVDRVLMCRNFPPFLADRENIKFGDNSFLVAEPDGKLRIRSNPANPALIDRLARGDVPSWLTPIPVPGSPDYLFYAVDRK